MDWTVNVVVLLASATLLPLIQPGQAADPVYSPTTVSDSAGNSADAASSVAWVALPTGDPYTTSEPERVTAGLEAYYSMVRGFINTIVFPKGLPDDIITKAANGDLSSIMSEYQSYVSYFLGYAICTVLGILFIILFPIIGCCFCCCRCCGKCGGKRQQPMKNAGNKYRRNTFIVILLALLIMGVVGCVCVYINNGETSEAIKAFPESTIDAIDDIQIYANNTFDQATHIARTNYEFLKLALNRDLDNIAYLVGLPLRQDIEANTAILTTLTTAYALDTKLTDANASLTDVGNNVTALESSVTALENEMNTVSQNLANIFPCATCPAGAPVPDYATALSVTLDTTQFPNLTQSKADMATATSSNLTSKVVDAETELQNIPETVANDSLSTRNRMKNNTNNLSDDIDPMIDQITDIKDLVNNNNDINTFKDDITDYGDMAKKYDKYRSYGGAGLAGFILLILVLAFLGVGFGVMGCDSQGHPNTRGCLSNTGGICLMASAGLIFIFSALFMLLTTLPFLLGAPLDRFVCQPITDTTFDTLEDMVDVQYNDAKEGTGKYFLGQMIFSDNTVNVTLSGLMRDCKKGESAYNAFKLSLKFDLGDLLNYTKTLDVQAEIDAINVDLSSVDVYPSALQTQMADMDNAVDVNFTKFYEQLFLKEGELMKLSRKGMQPRYYFLFNDVLLYTTPVAMGYRLNNILQLAGMKVSVAAQDEYKMEFSIVAVQRSFSVAGASLEERDDWISALNHAIEENAQKRNTFEAVRTGAQVLMDKDFVLGHKAPLWIPDSRVTMCMLCTCEFTVTWRRHHCRACGRIVCGNCSDCKAPLRYLKYKTARVCDECYKSLETAAAKETTGDVEPAAEKESEEGMSLLSINGLFERFNKIRLSGRSDKKLVVHRPGRLKEVAANDEGASMSGYLQRCHKGRKWKRFWYVIKDKVLYTFKATQDRAAKDSMALLGYEVTRLSEFYEGVEPALLFQLSHSNTAPIVFRTDSATATERWVTVMRESTIA